MARSLAAATTILILGGCRPPPYLAALDDPHHVTRCAASQLRITLGPWSGALGTGIAFMRVVNSSPIECRVRGYPHLQMLNARGRQMATAVSHGRAGTWPDGGPRRIVLYPGGAANAVLAWGDNGMTLADGSEQPCGEAHALVVAFPGIRPTIVIPGKGRRYGPYTISPCGNYLAVTALKAGERPVPKR